MQCRCPVCGGLTQIPTDLLNYLVRCDVCGGLLRPIVAPKDNGKTYLKAEPANVGRVRENAATNSGVAELLSPPLTARRKPETPPPVPTQPPPVPGSQNAQDELPQVSLAEMAALAAISGPSPLSKSKPQTKKSTLGITTLGIVSAVVIACTIIGITNFTRLSSVRAAPDFEPLFDKITHPSEPPAKQIAAPINKKPAHTNKPPVTKPPALPTHIPTETEIPADPRAPLTAHPAEPTGDLFPNVK